jgi:asparagine synthase (glutamine-hydrolysing)
MVGLCGWFSPRHAADPQAIAAMTAPLTRFDGSGVRTASAAFGALAGAGARFDVFQDHEKLVAVWGRPRVADTDLTMLAERHGMARALAQTYADRGPDLVAAVSGAFALAILDGLNGKAMLAIDRMGVHPLCYAVTGDTLVFGSTLHAITAFPAVTPRLNPQAVYDYLYFHMVPGPQTIYAEMYRLLPGTILLWQDGRTQTRSYWDMQYVETEERPFPELRENFLSLLRDAVSDVADGGPVGTFLSGGTDSSTVAGMLGQVTGEPARTYSIGFEAQGYDEMRYARIAARHFGARHHEYYVTPSDVVSAIPRIAAIHDQPFGNSSAVPTYYCAKLARDDGVSALLGGDGGDELFGGNERYAKQYVYSLYSDLPRTVRKSVFEPMLGVLPHVGLMGKAQRYVKNASMPMPARYDNYNFLERFGTATVFTGHFLDQVNPALPPAQMADVYHSARAGSLINRMLAFDLKYTLADNDLPKVMRSCELAGIEVRFPLLNDALVSFSARLSPDLKLRRTRLRYFFKRALRDFLPDEIIAKTKHGFGLPFGPWFLAHPPLRQMVLDSLADLKRRRIVRPEFIDELISIHVREHAKYYSAMVWILMMLEQWLKQHEPAA